MNPIQLLGALELGLIYSLVAMGVYLSFRVLRFPDLTVDGSFPLGAAVYAASVTHGLHPLLAIVFAILAGAASGYLTALLATRFKMLNLLAGILTMSALYSINLRIMGNRPNLSLLGVPTLFESTYATFGILAITAILLVVLIVWILESQTGLALRLVGANPKMAQAQGINENKMIGAGLALSNACVAMGGALFSQVFGFADVTLGVGTIIIGLASVIIGETVLPTRTVLKAVVACVGGAILYRLFIALALNLNDLGLQSSDLNLVTTLVVILAMSLPKLRSLLKKELASLGKEPQSDQT